MKTYKTEQENFWAGEFGEKYIERNNTEALVSSNVRFFSDILAHTQEVDSVIEFGSNIGLNLRALKILNNKLDLAAIEINLSAVEELKKLEQVKVYANSIFEFDIDYKRDFVFTKGVLIHLNPNRLEEAYEILYKTSSKYICIAEYYNPYPVEINYRGFQDKLFKRDFAGEMLDRYKDLKLVAYNFCYHRDSNFPQDDITWFLLEKQK